MKKLINITVILTVLCLISCNKSPDDVNDKKNVYFGEISNENSYCSSAYAKDGNDYYYIHAEHEKVGKYYYVESLPSKYIIAIDSDYELLFNKTGMEEFLEYLPRPKVNELLVSLYDIETNELKETIDLKEVLNKYENENKAGFIKFQHYNILSIDESPCMKLDICDNFQLPKDLVSGYAKVSSKTIYVNLSTKEIIEEKDISKQKHKFKSNNMDLFNSDYYGAKSELKFSISSDKYWEGVVEAWVDIDNLNENYKKLYEKFPDLKEKIDKLKKEKKEARLFVVLTGNPRYEEVVELLTEDGQELSFKDIVIKSEESVDGMEHQIHSFDEWRKYYRVDEVDESVISPIIPR